MGSVLSELGDFTVRFTAYHTVMRNRIGAVGLELCQRHSQYACDGALA